MFPSEFPPSDRRTGHHHPRGAAVGKGASLQALRAGWRRLKSLNARLESGWAGDVLGGLSLGVSIYVLFIIGDMLQ